MCGIAGFNWPDQRMVKAMMDALRHRGPDDEGFYVDENVSLGHRRLSIVDLSEAGHQPMHYEHGGRRVTVTFNGEIFNYRLVRRELESEGYSFRTQSDTEIILAGYLAWGLDCVRHFNGMWAFALYDAAAGELVLSRDRFGEKPLHYRLHDGQLIFASEIKAILVHPVRRRADRAAVADYLYRSRANGRLTSFFEDVRMLPPAHNARFDLRARRLTLQQYYAPARAHRRVEPDEFRSVLKASVERRLVADVPISISLSGGTDSTSVAALTSELTQTPIKAFTTVTGEDVGDETALIAHFLELYPRFELERSSLSETRFCERYREIIFHMDEPFVRQSAYVRWEIAHLTGRHARKVLLNGEGADEILGGYLPFAPRFLVDLLHKHRLLRFVREMYFTLTHPERQRILAALRNGHALFGSRHETPEDSANALRSKFGIRLEPIEEQAPKYDDIKDYLFSLVHDYSLPRLLNCNDKMTMANSVEGRSPFLDHEFVDLAFSMDTDDLLVRGWRKFPLRQAMEGRVPDEILFRKSKAGFNAPIFDYLRNDSIRQRIESLFREPRTAVYFDPKAYLNEYQRFLARRGGDRAFLLHGLFLEEWTRMFDVEVA